MHSRAQKRLKALTKKFTLEAHTAFAYSLDLPYIFTINNKVEHVA
jgi:hypothetical protein